MEHRAECDALLVPLDPYEELLVNGSVVIDDSPAAVAPLEQRATEEQRLLYLTAIGDEKLLSARLYPAPFDESVRERQLALFTRLRSAAFAHGHGKVEARFLGGRIALRCSCGARLWADATVEPPLVDGEELIEQSCSC